MLLHIQPPVRQAFHTDQVEAAGNVPQALFRQVEPGGLGHAPPFLGREGGMGGESRPVLSGGTLPGLYLHKDQDLILHGHQIQFQTPVAPLGAPVASQDPAALPAQKVRRGLLSGPAEDKTRVRRIFSGSARAMRSFARVHGGIMPASGGGGKKEKRPCLLPGIVQIVAYPLRGDFQAKLPQGKNRAWKSPNTPRIAAG
jgi:hypothetical protein